MDFDFDTIWTVIKDTAKRGGEAATFIMTAGGSGAIEKSIAAYQNELSKHEASARDFRAAESDFRSEVNLLGKETEECIKLLNDAKDLVERLSYSAMRSQSQQFLGLGRLIFAACARRLRASTPQLSQERARA
jgi:hypothetical protein